MDIIKLDLTIHDLDRVADLILAADEEIYGTENPGGTARTVKGLIRAGNNFLGHENIYICTEGNYIRGLLIGYRGKGDGGLKTMLRLLLSLRLTEFASYLTLTSNLLHGAYTPDIEEDDFYVSVLVVDESARGKGIGSALLSKAVDIAKENNCKSVLLDVDAGNGAARSLYKKFGFRMSGRGSNGRDRTHHPEINTMELDLT